MPETTVQMSLDKSRVNKRGLPVVFDVVYTPNNQTKTNRADLVISYNRKQHACMFGLSLA